jgi:creatinine amidohydrolase
MATRLLLQEMTREEARGSAADMLVIVPLGATEQHGPHLPAGTDCYVVEHIAQAAAALVAAEIPVVVTPTLSFGSSHHHLPFGGTMSLSTETYYRVLYDLGESLITGGFRRIFFLNGHGGNAELMQLVARDLALKHPAHFAAASYWILAWEAMVQAQLPGLRQSPGGHAGVFETSLMLSLRSDLAREPRPHRDPIQSVDTKQSPRPYRTESHGSWQRIDGYSDSPDLATVAFGDAYLAVIVQEVGSALRAFYAAIAGT